MQIVGSAGANEQFCQFARAPAASGRGWVLSSAAQTPSSQSQKGPCKPPFCGEKALHPPQTPPCERRGFKFATPLDTLKPPPAASGRGWASSSAAQTPSSQSQKGPCKPPFCEEKVLHPPQTPPCERRGFQFATPLDTMKPPHAASGRGWALSSAAQTPSSQSQRAQENPAACAQYTLGGVLS